MQLHKLTCSYISLHAVTWACMQFPELACSSLSLHAVPWTLMKFNELTWSSMSLHEVPEACMQFHELACSFKTFYEVTVFVWAAHKNFAVLVERTQVCTINFQWTWRLTQIQRNKDARVFWVPPALRGLTWVQGWVMTMLNKNWAELTEMTVWPSKFPS